MKDLLTQLISATRGNGPSSTRLVYLVNGLAAVFCALVMTIGGILVYCNAGKADAVYWAAVAALWTATLGFGARTKNQQQKGSTEIALAPRNTMTVAATASGD
jgi:uncharacterized membrane protein